MLWDNNRVHPYGSGPGLLLVISPPYVCQCLHFADENLKASGVFVFTGIIRTLVHIYRFLHGHLRSERYEIFIQPYCI